MADIVGSVPLTLREAASGILGSISLACWIFLLVPQLIENYKYGSAEAISLAFIGVWFIGDVTNLIGALWANLVPVVIAIAIYFCIADGALIGQCLYYNVKNTRLARRITVNRQGEGGPSAGDAEDFVPEPTTPLLSRRMSENLGLLSSRRRSSSSMRRMSSRRSDRAKDSLTRILEESESRSVWVKNVLSVLGICAVGAAGWVIAWQSGVWKPTSAPSGNRPENMAVGAQILGYFSAVCYLGARIPQIIKNYREQSCEGLSLLFFIFSLLGNLSYGAGILFHSTEKDYFLKNLPWLIGSLGTIVEDIAIFVQFRIYAVPGALATCAVE
ncbi:hypothetical protein FQN57_005877 [Myotisia sp. PD_48]|nr:hypothetical protein FQN57_005877 [Myotisia sp. PD_48]